MDDDEYQRVFENNRRWVAEIRERDAGFFQRLAQAQQPDFLYIGCADSRIPETEVMGLAPGDVFVHRNVANIVSNTDINCHSVIQYAVGTLGVKHIVVCGHYGCGGVAAAMQAQDLGLLNGWLREVRDVYRLHKDELNAVSDETQRYRRLVELNVREQCINVLKTAVVQKSWLKYGRPHVHGWVYDLSDGLLHDLRIPEEDIMRGIREIYALEG